MFLVATSRHNRKSLVSKRWRTALALMAAGLMAPSVGWAQYTYVPTANQTGNWNTAARWVGGPAGTFPNAVDATATVDVPASTAPSGNYNIQISSTAGAAVTIGSLTVNDSSLATGTLRFGANGNGTITFQTSTGSASITENAGSPDSTFNTVIFAPVTFGSDTIITQNHNLLNNTGLNFNSSNNSAGGTTAAPGITVTKQGLGNVQFNVAPTAPGTGFQGNLIVNEGAVRDAANAFQNAAAVTVNSGGQYQLGSSTITNWNLGAGAVLTLNGSGKDPSTVNAEGAFRFNNNLTTANFNNAIVLASDSNIYVEANTAPVPPATVTYGHLILTQTVSGQGGLIKSGSGILELTQNDTYAGSTVINAGTLLVNNTEGSATGAGAVTVNAGAILGGSGTIDGPVSFVGGTLAAGNSPGTIHLGSTTFDSASLLNYQLDTPGVVGSGVNDLTVVTGDLVLDGTLNIEALVGFGVGTYRLFDYSGSLTDNGLVFGTVPSDFQFSIDTSIANEVNLTVTAVPEASTLALCSLGSAGFGLVWLRRKRAAKSAS